MATPVDTLAFFNLASAYLCADCDTVSNVSGQCPACASRNLLSLANALTPIEAGRTPSIQEIKGADHGSNN